MLAAAATIVGMSRVVLGVHYPTDVVAGACLGIGVTLVLSAALPRRPVATGSAALD